MRITHLMAGMAALLLGLGCSTTRPAEHKGPWWTYNAGTRTCVQADVSPATARSEEQARGGACRRLRSFDPDAYILMCTRTQGEKLRVRIAGFGRDETACRAAGRDVIRHLNELRRKK